MNNTYWMGVMVVITFALIVWLFGFSVGWAVS